MGLVAVALAFRFQAPLAVMTASALLLGLSLGSGHAASQHLRTEGLETRSFGHVVLSLETDSRKGATGESAFAHARFEDGREAFVYVDFPDEEPMLQGDVVMASGSCALPDWGNDEYLWQNGAHARFRVSSFERREAPQPLALLYAMRSRAIEGIGARDETRALLQALVCGYRRSIRDFPLYARFQACGLAHLVAVSGAHLVIVTSLMASVLRAARVARRISIAVLVCVMTSYFLFSGAAVSALRALLMSSAGLLALLGRRRPSALNALGLSMLFIIVTSPSSSVSASFALSALSTMGIVLFTPLVSHALASTVLARAPMLADALAVAIGASAMSQLLACSLFGMIPLVSLLANVACAPLFPVTCSLGLLSATCCLVAPPLSPLPLTAASLVTHMLCDAVTLLSRIPYSTVPVSLDTTAALLVTAVCAAALWLCWSRVKARHVAAPACALAIAFALHGALVAQEDAIIMLDVGQGDSFLVRSRGATLLVDTGNKDEQLLEQLARCSVTEIGSVLVTHSDDDHVGSLDALERGVHVERVIMADGLLQSQEPKNRDLCHQAASTAPEVVGVSAGDAFRVGAFKANVVWPNASADDGGNADSVCLLLEYDGDDDGLVDFRALFTGDAEAEQLESMIASGAVGNVDLLKVGHHGSKGGMTETQAGILGPEIALIGVGAGNRYGHPSAETLEILESIGCRVFRSDVDGQVKCALSPDAIRVELQ